MTTFYDAVIYTKEGLFFKLKNKDRYLQINEHGDLEFVNEKGKLLTKKTTCFDVTGTWQLVTKRGLI